MRNQPLNGLVNSRNACCHGFVFSSVEITQLGVAESSEDACDWRRVVEVHRLSSFAIESMVNGLNEQADDYLA